jgi:predicted DCC family thiol-disulfide oxidoreductase YuxK
MIPIDMARDASAWIVLYDPDCGFCRWSLGRLLAFDRAGRLRPVALGTDEADRLLADLTPEQREDSWHLVSPDGSRWSAGAAAPPLLRLLPRGQLPADLLERAPRLTERAYRWIADHRSIFSRVIPDGAKRQADVRIGRAEAIHASELDPAAQAPPSGATHREDAVQAASSAGSFSSR